jgi:hypothetical protein
MPVGPRLDDDQAVGSGLRARPLGCGAAGAIPALAILHAVAMPHLQRRVAVESQPDQASREPRRIAIGQRPRVLHQETRPLQHAHRAGPS